MKPIVGIFVIGACLLVVVRAFPSPSEGNFDPQPGIPTSLFEIEAQQHTQGIQDEQSPLAREKRHKKKVVIVNQYYSQPGYRQGYGCRGCGGYNNGYNGGYNNGYNGGYGYPSGGHYPSGGYGYPGDYGGYSGGHNGFKKFKG